MPCHEPSPDGKPFSMRMLARKRSNAPWFVSPRRRTSTIRRDESFDQNQLVTDMLDAFQAIRVVSYTLKSRKP